MELERKPQSDWHREPDCPPAAGGNPNNNAENDQYPLDAGGIGAALTELNNAWTSGARS